MLPVNNNVIFWLALVTQIINSFIVISLGEQLIFLRRLKLDKDSKYSRHSIQNIYASTLLSFLLVWIAFILGYLYNTPFLDASTRVNYLQMNTTGLIVFFIFKFFEDNSHRKTISFKEFDSVKFIRKLLFHNSISILLTLLTYLIILAQ